MSIPKILIAEDEPTIRFILGQVLRGIPAQVFEAEDGRQALEITGTHKDIDLAVLDLKMPGMSGTELCASLREALPGLKVIISSAFITDEDISELGALGVKVFLRKPYSISRLREAIQELTGC